MDPNRRKRGNKGGAKRLSLRKSLELDLLKDLDIDDTEIFEFKIEIKKVKALIKNELTISYFKYDISEKDYFLVSQTKPIKITKNDKSIVFPDNFSTTYDYFDYQLMRIEVETQDKVKYKTIINLFQLIRNGLKPIHLALDPNSKSQFLKPPDSHVETDIPELIININRKTRVIDNKFSSFYIELNMLDKFANTQKKMHYNIWKSNQNKNSELIFESNVICDKQKYIFQMAMIKQSILIDKDEDKNFSFEFKETDKHIGEVNILWSEILNLKLNEIKLLPLVYNPSENNFTKSKPKTKKDTNTQEIRGRVKLIYKDFNPLKFFDHLTNGLNLKFSLGIDFSVDHNNDFIKFHPKEYDSNIYLKMMEIFKKVFHVYDANNSYTSLGFGGIITTDRKVSHCFSMNNSKATNDKDIIPYSTDMDGVIDGYCQKLKMVINSNSRQLKLVLSTFIELVKNRMKIKDNKEYHILFIIVNGPLSDDPQEIKDLLFESSRLPISIVIFGLRIKEKDKTVFNFLSKLSK